MFTRFSDMKQIEKTEPDAAKAALSGKKQYPAFWAQSWRKAPFAPAASMTLVKQFPDSVHHTGYALDRHVEIP